MPDFKYALGVIVMLFSHVLGMHNIQRPIRHGLNSMMWNAFHKNPKCQKLKPAKCGEQRDTVLVNAYCPELNLAYVKNPKANSMGIKKYIIEQCPGNVLPERFFAVMRLSMSGDVPYVFTFVREPFARVVSAYGEVDAKTVHEKPCVAALGKGNSSRFWEIPRGQEPRRFEAFLDDFKYSRIPVECQPAHADPQIMRVCEVPKQAMQEIGLLERFEDQMPIIHESAKNASQRHQARLADISADSDLEWEWSLPYGTVKEKDKKAVTRSATSKTRQLVYDMYEADYECFGYPFPT
jgi:hypothetical protein